MSSKGPGTNKRFFVFLKSSFLLYYVASLCHFEDYRSEADVRENEQSIINAGFLFVCLFFL